MHFFFFARRWFFSVVSLLLFCKAFVFSVSAVVSFCMLYFLQPQRCFCQLFLHRVEHFRLLAFFFSFAQCALIVLFLLFPFFFCKFKHNFCILLQQDFKSLVQCNCFGVVHFYLSEHFLFLWKCIFPCLTF